jgi:hypothetical protein
MAIDITGISNENEFYTHHYLSAILENDLKEVFSEWRRKEEEENIPQPYTLLRSLRKEFFATQALLEKEKKTDERLRVQRSFLAQLLDTLGYQYHPQVVDLDDAGAIPLLGGINKADGSPDLWIVEALAGHGEEADPFELTFYAEQYPADSEEFTKPLEISIEEIVTRNIFSRAEPPRWVILLSFSQLLLLDRSKWHEKRLLRFDLREILDRRESTTLQAMTALLHRDSICPKDGMSLIDTLDENSHKHAFAVSEDLKYSLRRAIELLGNEAVYYLQEKLHEKVFGRNMAVQLTRECLRYMYRMLFLLYIEARPELGYLPSKSEEFRKGYSLESLRDLELVQLTTEESENGYFLHESIKTLFNLLYEGFQPKQRDLFATPDHHTFRISPLRSHLFDPRKTALLNKVRFRNCVLQEIIELMSLSRPARGRNSRRGRISYAQLGINQLGAVYEALLSYQGFFAETTLYEVKKADEQRNELETAYFVKPEDLEQYTEDERVYNDDGTLVKYEKGTFIYRLAGRDREKSASYYTPEVLTKCLVKYALKELLKDKSADDILELTVCEPAMGSAAFLNEAVNQLAKAYLERKQKETGRSITHEDYPTELQKAKMYIADNNVYGVDLNPVAVELAEVSLWLNTIYTGAFVPWFGMQLVCGNSLIGARRQVFSANLLKKDKKTDPLWLDAVPERVLPGEKRGQDSVYHFLLPDKGMAFYNDKVIKEMAGQEIKDINEWRKDFIQPLTISEINQLKKLSAAVDKLWQRHAEMQRGIDARTTDPLQVFGQDKPDEKFHLSSTEEKDRILDQELFSQNVRNSSPYRRLKLVMDYWCALWFWPIEQAELLPSRAEYLFDLTLLLEGNLYDAGAESKGQQLLFPDTRPKQKSLTMIDEFGYVNVDKLCAENKRFALVRELADSYRYLHWELEFADLFATRGGFNLVLGNPPWTRERLEPQKILSEYFPKINIRKYSAPDVKKEMPNIFEQNIVCFKEFLLEINRVLSSRNFISSKYYVLSGEANTNLYKCFLERSYNILCENGVVSLLHDSGVYDEPKANELRKTMLSRLILCVRFVNQLNHFPEQALGHAGQFAISIFCKQDRNVNFDAISNVFHPKTIDQSYNASLQSTKVPKIKDNFGWILTGHPDRIIRYDARVLSSLNKHKETHKNYLSEPLLNIYANDHLDSLIKRAKIPTLKNKYNYLKGFPLIDETTDRKKGYIKRSTMRPNCLSELILSAPHIYVGNPAFKEPNYGCKSKGDYSSIDIENVGKDFISRAVFNFSNSHHLKDIITNESVLIDVADFRFAWRNWVSSSNERTLISTIIPPGVSHVNKIFSMRFPNYNDLCIFSGLSFSIVYDFFIRVTGIDNVWSDDILSLPFPNIVNNKLQFEIIKNTLKLVCVTSYYKKLWDHFLPENLEWSKDNIFQTSKSRLDSLIKIDVLASMALGINLDRLKLIYSTQFPILFEIDQETFYDKNGRIVFTCSKGHSGVGLTRSEWDEIKDMQSGTISRTIIDDTQPGGPVERTITYEAPFDRCDREKDYEVVWAEFERRFAG